MSYRAGLGVQFQQFVSLAPLDILVPGTLAQGVIPAVCLSHIPGYPHSQSAGSCTRCFLLLPSGAGAEQGTAIKSHS